MSDVLEVENHDHLRVMRLNRPERKNALNGPLLAALVAELRAAAAAEDVWAVGITGNGDAFCSGLDLDQAAAEPTDDEEPSPSGEVEHFALLMRVECEKPILAGINGVAVGMGVSLAMAADIRIAAPSARFHPGYARVATSPDGGATVTVTEALGYEGAMRFFLEQRMVGAAEARELGLVGEVSATDDEFPDRFLDYGRMLAEVAPIAARQTKRLLGRAAPVVDLRAQLDEEVRLALHGLASEDSAEAIRAMATRTTPTFHGR